MSKDNDRKGYNSPVCISLVISALSFGLSFIVAISNCNQNNKIEELEYSKNLITFRPKLDILDVKINSYVLNFDKKMFDQNVMTQSKLSLDSDTILDLSATLDVTFTLTLVNSGNSSANIFLEMYADTSYGGPFLYIKLDSILENIDTCALTSDYYTLEQLDVNDTTNIKERITVKFVDNNSFTLHSLIFYKNEMDQYFDTYYWAKFTMNDLYFDSYNVSNSKFGIAAAKKDLINFVKKESSNVYSRVYNQTERKVLDRFIERQNQLRCN